MNLDDDTIKVLNLLLSPVAGLLGVLLGGYIQKRISAGQERSKRTIDLHAQFHSSEMLGHREEAEALLLPVPRPIKLKDLASPGRPHAIKSVWIIVEFYCRLEATIRHRQGNKAIMADLFGQTFVYWYEGFLKGSLDGSGWDEHQRLDDLAEEIRRSAGKRRYATWVTHAETEYAAQRERLRKEAPHLFKEQEPEADAEGVKPCK